MKATLKQDKVENLLCHLYQFRQTGSPQVTEISTDFQMLIDDQLPLIYTESRKGVETKRKKIDSYLHITEFNTLWFTSFKGQFQKSETQ